MSHCDFKGLHTSCIRYCYMCSNSDNWALHIVTWSELETWQLNALLEHIYGFFIVALDPHKRTWLLAILHSCTIHYLISWKWSMLIVIFQLSTDLIWPLHCGSLRPSVSLQQSESCTIAAAWCLNLFHLTTFKLSYSYQVMPHHLWCVGCMIHKQQGCIVCMPILASHLAFRKYMGDVML